MDEKILVSKSLLEFAFDILNKLDYIARPDDGDSVILSGEFSLDWFCYVKNHLKRAINEA